MLIRYFFIACELVNDKIEHDVDLDIELFVMVSIFSSAINSAQHIKK